MAIIHVDNMPYEVDGAGNLLHACLSRGLNLPYFCWHPAMGSVGACRQCAVKLFKDEKDSQGKIVMACMTEVHDGARLSIKDAEASEFRKSVIEWLMVNHPHDCPVCDEGGECHLQDMTVMTGHNYRRYRFTKRTHRNQYLGPFVNHEMNRCIQCYRCVRFYRDYAGGRDFDVFGCHDDLYFGREEEGVLENEFSGNLVEVCPTGVFTDKTLKAHYTRKWDLQTAPAICTHCSLGCNTIPGEREGLLRRVRNRYHGEVNGYFLCDRGRYGYDFANGSLRIRSSVRRSAQGEESVESEQVARVLGPLVSRKERLIGIGSARASLEANYLLRRLVGPERFSLGLPSARKALLTASLKLLREGPARSPSLREISEADAVLVLGEDLTNTAPLIALGLRQSVLQAPQAIASHLHIPRWHDQAFRNAIGESLGPLFLAVPYATHLDDIARNTFRATPSDIARLGAAVADHIRQEGTEGDPLAKEIATSLTSAKRPVVISGVHSGSLSVIEAAAQVAWALCDKGIAAYLSLVPSECNSFGVGLMGGISLEEVEKELGTGADTVIILENDISRFGQVGERILSSSRNTIVLDSVRHPTADRAQFVLASGTAFESDGTFVNQEGRAQRSVRVFIAPEGIKEDWRWLRDLLISQGDREAAKLRDFSEVTALVAENDPTFKPITEIVPAQVTPVPGERIPREPHRSSGRTAVTANITVHEPKPPADPDSPLSFSMEGDASHPPSSLIPFFWSPGWNSVQAVAKYQREVGGPLRGGDPGRRLIEPGDGARSPFGPRPEPFRKREGEFLLFTIYQIFGSEQLSAMSPPIRERIPDDFVALNQLDAARLGVQEGDKLEVTVTGFTLHGTARLELGVPEGSAGVFLRLRQDLAFPQKPYGTIRRLEEKTWAA